MRRILFVNASISWVSWVVRMMVVPWSLLISRIILRTAIFETASVVPAKAAGHDFNGTAFSGAVGTYIAHDFTLTDMKGDILQRVDGFIFPVEQGRKGGPQTGIPSGHPVCLADMFHRNHVFILPRKPVRHFSIKFLFYSLDKGLSIALK